MVLKPTELILFNVVTCCMTLHEAIERLLDLENRPLSTKEIADKLNKNGWYVKKDKSPISAYQIHGRTNNYPTIFDKDGSLVSLSKTIAKLEKTKHHINDVALDLTHKINLTLKSSFEPIIYPDTKILILGSLPGDQSIKQEEYYAHPRNRFWKIMTTLAKVEMTDCYEQKKNLLKRLKVGLWDVAHSAVRKGSLDSDIQDELPNDFDNLFKKYKSICLIAFNGQKAEKFFDRHVEREAGMDYISLPSSSPANASISFESICDSWNVAFSQA